MTIVPSEQRRTHHARDAALATNVGRNTLESHDGAGTSLLYQGTRDGAQG